jgi:hypothetical protein
MLRSMRRYGGRLEHLQPRLHVPTVLDGVPRIAVRLGFPLELEVVNEALEGKLLAVCPAMTRGYVLLDSR